MNKINRRKAPKWINHLSGCEVFVFGSNLQGHHGGGAARIAYEKFGAEWGVGNGPTGRCYAIPTMHGGLEEIRPYVKKFVEYAISHPNQRFLLTRIGCGIAGFSDEDMCLLFEGGKDYPNILNVPNIAIPEEWWAPLLVPITIGVDYPAGDDQIQGPVSEERLMDLCDKYRYQIGAGVRTCLPNLTVRYVAENEKFGYASFGDYFFHRGRFYVITTKDEYASEHNQDVMLEHFGDECEGRGYAIERIFAGVPTGYRDEYDKMIYTGDVIKLWRGDRDVDDQCDKWALGDWHFDGHDDYDFILDNHNLSLKECYRMRLSMERIGSVFFKLREGDSMSLRRRVMGFNHPYSTPKQRAHDLIMARYTPNFEQEDWKYDALDTLGVEPYNI